MESAFGIEHGFSKSLVNGSWKKASELSSKERKAVGGYRKLRGVTESDKTFRDVNAPATKEMHRQLDNSHKGGVFAPSEIKTHHLKSGKTKSYGWGAYSLGNPLSGTSMAGTTSRIGGKRGAAKVIYSNTQSAGGSMHPESTLKHELAHAAPKRSSYRLHQLHQDPKKLMREEARADAAIGHYATHPEVQSAYASAARGVKRKEHRNHALAVLSRSKDGYRGVKPADLKEYTDVHDKIHGAHKVPGSAPHEIVGRKVKNAVVHTVVEHPEVAATTSAGAALTIVANQKRQRKGEGIKAYNQRVNRKKS